MIVKKNKFGARSEVQVVVTDGFSSKSNGATLPQRKVCLIAGFTCGVGAERASSARAKKKLPLPTA